MREAIWIIGRGLLGSAIEMRIKTDCSETQIFVPPCFSWDDSAKLGSELTHAVASFGDTAKQCGRYRLFWAAGRSVMSSSEDDVRSETRNLALFLSILRSDANLKSVPGTLSFASSAGGMYAGSTDDTITEETLPMPTTAYGRGKLEQEALVAASAHPLCGVLIARISNLYGPKQSRTKKQGLLTHIARCMLTRAPIHIYVPFDTMRDYLHVSDAAADMTNASMLAAAGDVVTKIIASEEPATIAAIIGLFRRITRRTPLLSTGTNELGAVYPHRMRFASKVLQSARESRRISLPEGIAETFAVERLHYAAEGMPA